MSGLTSGRAPGARAPGLVRAPRRAVGGAPCDTGAATRGGVGRGEIRRGLRSGVSGESVTVPVTGAAELAGLLLVVGPAANGELARRGLQR
jgi:hypothetical protein